MSNNENQNIHIITNYNMKFENISKLSDIDIESILLRRLELKYYFNQLTPGMRFIEPDGYDDFLYEIVSINLKIFKFKYFEVAFPDKELTSSILYIPRRILITDKNVEDVNYNEFIFNKPNQDIIMQLHNNTIWEKTLYYKLYIKSLLKIIKVKNTVIQNFKNEIDKQIYINVDSKKVLSLKNYINSMIKKYGIPEEQKLENLPLTELKEIHKENQLQLKTEEKLRYNLKIWIDKANKYKELYTKSITNKNQ